MKKSDARVLILNRNNYPVEIVLNNGDKIIVSPREKALVKKDNVNAEKVPAGIVIKEQ